MTLEQLEEQPKQQKIVVAIKWSFDQDYTIYNFAKDEVIDTQKQFEELEQGKIVAIVLRSDQDDTICIFNKAGFISMHEQFEEQPELQMLSAFKWHNDKNGTRYIQYGKGMYLSGENKLS